MDAGERMQVRKVCRRCGYTSCWAGDWQRHAARCHSPRVVRVPQVRKGEVYPKPKPVVYPPGVLAGALIHFLNRR